MDKRPMKHRPSPVFEHPDFDAHERVLFVSDDETGLRGIIALHHLGPANRTGGGLRMWPYPGEAAALLDVLRLSQAMSFKFALAGLPVGGGKSVIIGDPRTDKTRELLTSYARRLNVLGGIYYCGPDVGTNAADMEEIARTSPYVRGLPGQSGDTSPATAWGVFHAIRAAVEFQTGASSLDGLTVAVQGLGGVGGHLCRFLAEAGARLIVADIDPERVKAMARRFGAEAAETDAVVFADADVFAPCALGGVIDETAAERLPARIVCGGANNQLTSPAAAERLAERGVLFVPDYVANAGGVINASVEARGEVYDKDRTFTAVERIRQTTLDVLRASREAGVTPNAAAESLARDVLKQWRAARDAKAAAKRA